MPTKSIISYITEDKPNLKSAFDIINTEVKRGKQMTEEQLLFKQETMSMVDFNEFLLNAVECGLIDLDTALIFKGE
ncbi:middle expressed protein 1 [Lactococcus phage 2R15S2]|uniref:Middle expressed protein 1 n=12 Tax=Skunavirus TaxID=1623305 RepID=A0A3G1FH79_9CAUD|nr:middle expressed protein 1 [Lactococcus phage 10W18]YP_009875854.1 middle expressed protein 1 [Lactococcus phage 3R16S]ALM64959.1 middle expressed protein 1 [Lactococcus phage 936 group phage Phi10.5]ANY28786.1 middle expressed protein 1 [Lactococcus phage 10W22S]AOQ29502.1 middle expressed protein 1 [Lactococcus phage 3R07S]AOQ29560.1 middle expressed protein 1 [Lactococcus phage 2R14S]AOQ29620.1 middle expressed protein 1 [Lactococcus phage 2R15M]AOQ29739.1 middle expressed protein 1 [L